MRSPSEIAALLQEKIEVLSELLKDEEVS